MQNEESQKSYNKLRDFFKVRNSIIIFLILIIIPLAIFWQTTKFDFVWDDIKINLYDITTFQELNTNNIAQFCKGMFIPITYTVWALLKQLEQLFPTKQNYFNPFIYHLANVILHIINGFLVFAFLRLIIKNKWAVLCGTLIFLLHPIQVETVAWVSEFRGLLSTAFCLSALLLYLNANQKYETSSRKNLIFYYINSLLLFIFAILSKPSAVIIPIYACFLDMYICKNSFKHSFMRILPWFIVIIPIIYLTKHSQPSNIINVFVPFYIRPLIWMDAINFYIYKILYPLHLASSYARIPQSVINHWWLYVEWLIPITIIYVLWYIRKRFPLLIISFLFFIIGFLPVSGFVSFVFQNWSTVADRYIYLSMIGISLVFAYILSKIKHPLLWFSVGLLICFLGVQSYFIQIPVWKNDFTLWNHCIKVTNCDARAYNNRAIEFSNMEKYGKALEDYNKALDINPQHKNSYYGRALVYCSLEEYDEAWEDINQFIKLGGNVDSKFLSVLKKFCLSNND